MAPHMTQEAYAETWGQLLATWNKYELGVRPIPLGLAERLVRRYPGLTLDWIYLGVESGLQNPALLEQLEAGRRRK